MNTTQTMATLQENQWLENQAKRSLNRLLPRIEARIRRDTGIRFIESDWDMFACRLKDNFARLFMLMYQLYGSQYDFFYHMEELIGVMAKSWVDRPADLKLLDRDREANQNWFQSNRMVGAVCYVDLFAGNLNGLRKRIPYFKELGITYLHLMPLFKSPLGENDGGYAVSSYRDVNPSFGAMEQLTELTSEFRREGISLVLDFVFNHTSNEHAWALRARAGEEDYQDFYLMFPDRHMPDQYERNLREIFPDEHPGAFTYFADTGKWVWTTFHSYQWDLNYANPAVFNQMSDELLALANVGVEALRLDAVAFIWKKLGTACENLPEAHLLIQAFNAVMRISAPALQFKSEAIVHPDDVVKYIDPHECQLSYNPLLMALLWNSLATREVNLLSLALRERHALPAGCAWVNYVRCHDDIGWTFSDDDAARLGINGYDHRRFLNAFYTGRFAGSFARGLPFQENPITGDCRISGTGASLAGLEKAMHEETPVEVELALRRILLLHGIILTTGGVPLIYLGDEVGQLNDYKYRNDPTKANDSRWVHRIATDWDQMALRNDASTLPGRIYTRLHRLIEIRTMHDAFSGNELQVMDTANNHVLGYVRTHGSSRVIVLANFSETDQTLSMNLLRLYGLGYEFEELITGKKILEADIALQPYDLVYIQCA